MSKQPWIIGLGVGVMLLVAVALLHSSASAGAGASKGASRAARHSAHSGHMHGHSSSSSSSEGEECYWEFEKYVASDAEKEWRAKIETSKDHICQALRGPFAPLNEALLAASDQLTPAAVPEKSDEEFAAMCSSPNHHHTPLIFDEKFFSYMIYRRACKSTRTGTVTLDKTAGHRRVFLEPIAGTLRSPRICDDYEKYLFDHNFMVVDGWLMNHTRTTNGKGYLFDAGASSWREGNGGSSQHWLHHVFRDQCMNFDEYFCWEMESIDTTKVFDQIPGPIRPKYHWYNIGINAEPQSWDNPLNHIRQRCKPEDYCVLKLDIDNTPIEMAIVDQILNSPDLHKLIDEFFWENHVDLEPLRRSWGSLTQYTVAASLDTFAKLRSLGIRSHSWT